MTRLPIMHKSQGFHHMSLRATVCHTVPYVSLFVYCDLFKCGMQLQGYWYSNSQDIIHFHERTFFSNCCILEVTRSYQVCNHKLYVIDEFKINKEYL